MFSPTILPNGAEVIGLHVQSSAISVFSSRIINLTGMSGYEPSTDNRARSGGRVIGVICFTCSGSIFQDIIIENLVGGTPGTRCAGGRACTSSEGGGRALGMSFHVSSNVIVDQVDVSNISTGGIAQDGSRNDAAGFLIEEDYSSKIYLSLVPSSVAASMKYVPMAPCLRPCDENIQITYQNISPPSLELRNTVDGMGVYHYTGPSFTEIAFSYFEPYITPQISTVMNLKNDGNITTAAAYFDGILRVIMQNAYIDGGMIGAPARRSMVYASGTETAGIYVRNSNLFHLESSMVTHVYAGDGSRAVDQQWAKVGGRGGNAFGVIVFGCDSVIMKNLYVDKVKAGSGGYAEGNNTSGGEGGAAVGIVLQNVTSATFEDINVNNIAGGDKGEAYCGECDKKGILGTGIGIALSSSHARVTPSSTVDIYDIMMGNNNERSDLPRTVLYDSQSTYNIISTITPSVITNTIKTFVFPFIRAWDHVLFTTWDDCTMTKNYSSVLATTDTSFRDFEMLNTIWHVGNDGEIILPYPLPLGRINMCYSPGDYESWDPMAFQDFFFEVVPVQATSSSSSSSASTSSTLTTGPLLSSSTTTSATSSSLISSATSTLSSSSAAAASSSSSSTSTSSTTGRDATIPASIIVQANNKTLNTTTTNKVGVNDIDSKLVAIVEIPLGSLPSHLTNHDNMTSTSPSILLVITSPSIRPPALNNTFLQIVSPIMDLKIRLANPPPSTNRSTSTIFNQPVTISFAASSVLLSSTASSTSTSSSSSLSPLCLGYYNITTEDWLCEDKDLRIANNVVVEADGTTVTRSFIEGRTLHFTSFAILLSTKPANPSSSGSPLDDHYAPSNAADGSAWYPGSTNFIVVLVCVGFVVVAAVVTAIIVSKRRQMRHRPQMIGAVELKSNSTMSL
eukprot:TRINITY_DN2504_c0_g1_i1.p1 TRINITY_DN2504_c0_g1~~TRINITY_DN2504_c0_g1_i1.p1  ORF type:complete len:1057 (+),score=216.33 TRINITY_DN2504_c0_g1_i1:455-3172(+)